MYKLSCIIIDDEPFAIESLKSLLKNCPDIEILNTFENPIDALKFIQSNNIDLIFLDIEMPELSGIDLLKKMENPPATIITSAYPQYAIQGFELDVLDYLIKPISNERLNKSILKAKEYLEVRKNKPSEKNFLFIKCEKVIEKIFTDDILYIESLHNYVAIHTENKKYVTYNSLKNIESMLPKNKFIKIQKSYIAAINKIDSLEGYTLSIKNLKLPISRSKKEEILQILNSK